MSKIKKGQGPQSAGSYRNFKLTHQSLSITEVNFKKQTLLGLTELTLLPLTATGKLWKLCLNCKQCRILRITVNGSLKASYSYMDPTLCICPQESKKRNLEFYDSCHHSKVRSCDSDCTSNAGELIVKIPKDVYNSTTSGGWEFCPIKVRIDFSLEHPKGGVRFVVSELGTSEAMQHAHMYSYGLENSSRLWFPCVDVYSEPCLWDISFVVPANMVAVSCGDLIETVLSSDGKKKTYNYSLQIPTAAPCIGFAIGCFEIYPDPVMQEVTHFCLPGLLPILKNSVQFVHQVFGFYEELLSARFPHSSYKLVFVNGPYQEYSSYSTLGLFDTNLLHSHRIIDQVMVTRRVIGQAVAKQYFGCYALPQSWNDWWLPCGISGYLSGLFSRKVFGNTEYMYWVMAEQKKVYDYEKDHVLAPLCGTLAALQITDTSPSVPSGRMSFHPKLMSGHELEILRSKSHLVIRMVQLKIGQDLLFQVFNKLLTLASTASQSKECSLWHNLLVSTEGFMKLLTMVSGKDMSHFMEQWVCNNGIPHLFASYTFVRKKNFVELKLKQDTSERSSKFVGSMSVIVQEFDGCFTHNIQIEDLVSTHELPCHSKIRKAKKRKVPLLHGEEIDIDISNLDNEVPILWVRVDPDYQWIRRLSTEQSDTTWQNMLKYERDATAQLDALEALEDYPSTLTRDCYRDTLLNTCFYCHVRLQAAAKLTKYLTDTASTGSSPSFLTALYQKLFGSAAQQNIVRFNDFTDVATYFLQKGVALCIARLRNIHKQCPKEVVSFIMDLFKYSDNQTNKYSADNYTSALIEALSEMVTPKVAMALPAGIDFAKTPAAGLTRDVQIILQEIVQHLNIEKVLPSYKYVVTCSCLKCLRVLQKNGHLPSDSTLFREYAEKWNFVDVRVAALRAIVDIVQAEQSESDLEYLLNIVENDEPRIRLEVLTSLSLMPPFTRRTESKLNNLPLVERLWGMMSTGFYYDNRLRSAVVRLYEAMFGRLTPSCVPQGLGIVIDLKEKVARPNIGSPITTPKTSQDMKPTLSLITAPITEDTSVVRVSTLASGSTNPSSIPSSPISLQSPSDASSLSLVKVTVLDQNTPPPDPPSSKVAGQPPLSLKIPTSHLKKRFSPSITLEGFDNRSATDSPESMLSAGGLSDEMSSTSPSQQKHKRHKLEHKEHKHKHKKKKGKKNKHKHKHGTHDVDVECVDM